MGSCHRCTSRLDNTSRWGNLRDACGGCNRTMGMNFDLHNVVQCQVFFTSISISLINVYFLFDVISRLHARLTESLSRSGRDERANGISYREARSA